MKIRVNLKVDSCHLWQRSNEFQGMMKRFFSKFFTPLDFNPLIDINAICLVTSPGIYRDTSGNKTKWVRPETNI